MSSSLLDVQAQTEAAGSRRISGSHVEEVEVSGLSSRFLMSHGRYHPQFPGILNVRKSPDGLRASGPIVPLMEMVASSFKTCLVYVFPEDRLFGVQLPNGTWNGIFSLVQDQKVDMSGVPLIMSPERIKVFDAGEWIQSAFRSIVHLRPTPEADILGFR
ncbi:hypothetical protein O3P69_006858 [Scylla paramamosain]|uniref:Uncharacterized protein n=1 Tax=Scylla paramamosain TaxID=85552 RepID=A0AAW0U1B5_SCYPA